MAGYLLMPAYLERPLVAVVGFIAPPSQSHRTLSGTNKSRSPKVRIMESLPSERELVVMEKLLSGNKHFDVYFTDNRIVGLHSFKAAATGTGAAFGLAGSLVELGVGKIREGRRKEQEEQMKKMTLDERLAADGKNFALPYGEVHEVKLGKFLAGRNVKIKGGKIDMKFILTKEQFERLKTVLPTVAGLAGKLEIPN
jgi:hypothetical protein